MSNINDITTQWINADATLEKIEEYIKNHLRYDQRFIMIRLVIDTTLSSTSVDAINTIASINEQLRQNIRATDFVANIKENQYLFMIRSPNQDNDSSIVSRLSRLVSDISSGRCFGRTFYAAHQIGDNSTNLIEKVLH